MVTLLYLACSTSEPGTKPDLAVIHTVDTAPDSNPTESTPSDSDPPDSPPDDSEPPPADADGDGSFTPEDCDDADPEIHPGARDACDGVDQDCDGELQGDGSCGEIGVWADLEVGWWVGDMNAPDSRAHPEGQLDGRGVMMGQAMGFTAPTTENTWGAVMIVGGMPSGPDTPWTEAEILGVWASKQGEDFLEMARVGGDVNGDGWDDVWLLGTGTSGYCDAELFLMLGPAASWPTEAAYPRDVADGWWLQSNLDDNFGGSHDVGEDIDADGLADALVVAYGNVWDNRGGSLHIILGRAESSRFGADISEELTLWYGDTHQEKASSASLGVDADGDGLHEILGNVASAEDGWPSGLAYILGSELSTANGGRLIDWATVTSGAPEMYFEFMADSPGDLDQDGLEDLMFASTKQVSTNLQEHCLQFVSAAELLRQTDWSNAVLAVACFDNDSGTTMIQTPDMDGDGILDANWMMRADFTDANGHQEVSGPLTCLVPSSRLALEGRVDVFEVGWCVSDGGVGAPDMNGDGVPEFVGYRTEWDDSPYEGAYGTEVILGFPLPWDDPTKW